MDGNHFCELRDIFYGATEEGELIAFIPDRNGVIDSVSANKRDIVPRIANAILSASEENSFAVSAYNNIAKKCSMSRHDFLHYYGEWLLSGYCHNFVASCDEDILTEYLCDDISLEGERRKYVYSSAPFLTYTPSINSAIKSLLLPIFRIDTAIKIDDDFLITDTLSHFDALKWLQLVARRYENDPEIEELFFKYSKKATSTPKAWPYVFLPRKVKQSDILPAAVVESSSMSAILKSQSFVLVSAVSEDIWCDDYKDISSGFLVILQYAPHCLRIVTKTESLMTELRKIKGQR